MNKRIYNFSAGPAILPVPVLERAKHELLSLAGIGMSVMEISHRSHHFEAILESAKSNLRELLNIPSNFEVLFLQGGASLQFSMIPLNFLRAGETADYVVTGAWGKKAVVEARKCSDVKVIYSSESTGFRTVPIKEELAFTRDAAYVHYTSNETIEGVEFKYELEAGGIPIVCDASSNILSKPIDFNYYSLVYAGAQKNIGPSGVCVVIIREDLLKKVPDNQHSMLDYRAISSHGSMLNTPNTWGIYLVKLVTDWIKDQGGVPAIEQINRKKASILYDAIDSSDGFYEGHAEKQARSLMNVTFNLPTEELERKFALEAAANGLDGLKGHRSVGGIRASIYNAFPSEGCTKLVEFMNEFREKS